MAQCPDPDWAHEQHIQRIVNKHRLAVRVRYVEFVNADTWDLASPGGQVVTLAPTDADAETEVELVQYTRQMAGLHFDLLRAVRTNDWRTADAPTDTPPPASKAPRIGPAATDEHGPMPIGAASTGGSLKCPLCNDFRTKFVNGLVGHLTKKHEGTVLDEAGAAMLRGLGRRTCAECGWMRAARGRTCARCGSSRGSLELRAGHMILAVPVGPMSEDEAAPGSPNDAGGVDEASVEKGDGEGAVHERLSHQLRPLLFAAREQFAVLRAGRRIVRVVTHAPRYPLVGRQPCHPVQGSGGR